jgi:hypothetical protein
LNDVEREFDHDVTLGVFGVDNLVPEFRPQLRIDDRHRFVDGDGMSDVV